MQICSGIQKLMGGEDSQTRRQHGDLISLLLFFQNNESRLKGVNHNPHRCFMFQGGIG
jgi:hypothetical protein